MRLCYIIPLLIAVALIPVVKSEFEERFFTQKLVPIDFLDQREWENLYYIDEEYYQPGGPIFVFVGGADFYSTIYRLNTSHFFDIGREMHALLIATEHRFFGQSRPTQNTSVHNMQYLTSRYAVEDVANLIQYLKSEYDDAPVVTHGFDHGGAVAVWVAQAYPNLIEGTWAAAAPLLAIKDYGEYLVNSGEAVRIAGGDQCYDNLEAAFIQMDYRYENGDYPYLENQFNLCQSFTPGNNMEASAFFSALALVTGTILRLTHIYGVQQMCFYLQAADNELEGLAAFLDLLLEECIGIDINAALDVYREENWDTYSTFYGTRQVSYQYCREYGWFKPSSHLNQPFGNRFPVEFIQEQCKTLFGPIFTPSAILQFMIDTNNRFGGLRPNVTNVYFTDGELDPSKTLGVLESYHPTIEVDIIPLMAAGAEIYSISTIDTSELLAVKYRARDLIMHWIYDRKISSSN